MITMVLETATTAAAVALLDDGEVLAEMVASDDRHHTELASRLARSIG